MWSCVSVASIAWERNDIFCSFHCCSARQYKCIVSVTIQIGEVGKYVSLWLPDNIMKRMVHSSQHCNSFALVHESIYLRSWILLDVLTCFLWKNIFFVFRWVLSRKLSNFQKYYLCSICLPQFAWDWNACLLLLLYHLCTICFIFRPYVWIPEKKQNGYLKAFQVLKLDKFR
jgi:hypothetical protein